MPYSQKFKLRMIERLVAPHAPSAISLSREVGVPQPTLSRWLRGARRLPSMTKQSNDDRNLNEPRNPKSWSAEEKYRVVIEAASIVDADLGEFLRKRGLHVAQLEEWRRVAAEAAHAALNPRAKSGREHLKADRRRVRELERELLRKDKALAETAALLVLKKKAQAIWGDEDDDTDPKSDK